jgi:hypothetical protein
MAVVTISALELGPELVAGIPRYIAFETNMPSTIYYTVDGSTPSLSSNVYVDPILLPDNSCNVQLYAMAISGEDIGYLYLFFGADITTIRRSHRVEGYGAGIVLDAYGKDWIFYDGYSLDSIDETVVPTRYSDYELKELEIKYSKTGQNGIGNGTFPWPGPSPEDIDQSYSPLGPEESSPNDQNVYFDPRAMYIVIDGTMADGYVDQSVFPINRPYGGTMNPAKYLNGQLMYSPCPFISGGLVRSFVNYNTGIMISYYFDHVDCRWIKSIQKFTKSVDVPDHIGSRNQSGPPLVFKWVYCNRTFI